MAKTRRRKAARKKAPRKKVARKRPLLGVVSSVRATELGEESCTARQTRFAYEYIATPGLNATKAAIAAGCPAKSAHVQGSRWLRNTKVKALIAELKALRAERVLVKADELLANLMPLCMSNITAFIKDGKLMNLADIKKLPREVTAALGSVKQTEKIDKAGNSVIVIELKLHPKIPALALAMKHVGARASDKKAPDRLPRILTVESGLGAPPGSAA